MKGAASTRTGMIGQSRTAEDVQPRVTPKVTVKPRSSSAPRLATAAHDRTVGRDRALVDRDAPKLAPHHGNSLFAMQCAAKSSSPKKAERRRSGSDVGRTTRRVPMKRTKSAGDLGQVRSVGGVESARMDRLTEAALAGVQGPDAERAELYRPLVEGAVRGIAPSLAKIDASDGALLTKLGQHLADNLDSHVRQAVRMELEATGKLGDATGARYREIVGPMVRNPAFARKYPTMERAMGVEAGHFVQNMVKACDRVAADIGAIDAHVLPGGGPPARGLKDIHVTSSDPHHGGARVLILTFDNDKRAVYKPRDVAIDAGLVGHSPGRVSLAETTSRLIKQTNPRAKDIPTHNFLPRNDGGDRYGYVECLTTGRAEDHALTPAEAKDYYRQAGRLAAMMYFSGVRDLHQGNLMVSGKQPYFTDVEIAFNPGIMQMTKSMDGGVSSMEMAGAFTSHSEKEYVDLAQAREGGGIRIDNRMAKTAPTDNFVYVQRPLAKTNYEGAAHWYRDQVAAGIKDVVDAYTANPDAVKASFDSMRGSHVRFHPTATATQLDRRQQMKLFPDAASTAQMKRSVRREEGRDEARRPFVDSMIHDLERGDVPYYTRELGQRDVIHNGERVVAQGYFEDDGISSAKGQIDALGTRAGRQRADEVSANLSELITKKPRVSGGRRLPTHVAMIGEVER